MSSILLETFKVMAKGGGDHFYCNAAQFEKNKDKWEKVGEKKSAPAPVEKESAKSKG